MQQTIRAHGSMHKQMGEGNSLLYSYGETYNHIRTTLRINMSNHKKPNKSRRRGIPNLVSTAPSHYLHLTYCSLVTCNQIVPYVEPAKKGINPHYSLLRNTDLSKQVTSNHNIMSIPTCTITSTIQNGMK